MTKSIKIFVSILTAATVVLSAGFLLNRSKENKLKPENYPSDCQFVEPTDEDWSMLATNIYTWVRIIKENGLYKCENISGEPLFSVLISFGAFDDYDKYFENKSKDRDYEIDRINWILFNIYNMETGVSNKSKCDYGHFGSGCFKFYPNHPEINYCPMFNYDIVTDNYEKTDDGKLIVKINKRYYEDNSPAGSDKMIVGLKLIEGKRYWSLYEYHTS